MLLYDPKKKIESLREIKDQLLFRKVNNIYGQEVTLQTLKDNVSLSCESLGYLITKEGYVLPVVEGDIHPNVANYYLQRIAPKDWNIANRAGTYLDYLKALEALIYAPLPKECFSHPIDSSIAGLFFLPYHFHMMSEASLQRIQKIVKDMQGKDYTPVYSVNYQFFTQEDEEQLYNQRQYLLHSRQNY